MDGRQRIAAALSREGTPETPAVICYESIFIRDHWDELTGLPWWYEAEPDLGRQVQWRAEAIRRTGQDWYELPACGTRTERAALMLAEKAGTVRLTERRTGRTRILERPRVGGWESTGATASVHPAFPPRSPGQVDELVPASRADPAAGARADGRDELARLLLDGPGRTLFPIRQVGSPFWLCYGLWGFEGLMTLVADDPGLVRHACSRYLDLSIAEARRAAALGAMGMWVEECMTDMVGADAFRALVVPFLDPLLREIRALGMSSIYYFCGNPSGKWDLILSLPMDALALEEGKKGFRIELEDVADRVDGRLCLLGNLDAIWLLTHGGEAELESEIGRQIGAGRRNHGRFIMSIGSPVTPATSVERVRRYCETARRIGRGQA